jgi:hypothetical protein
MIMVEKPGVIRRAVAPASAAEDRTAVSAVEGVMEEDIANRNSEPSRETLDISKRRKTICGEGS